MSRHYLTTLLTAGPLAAQQAAYGRSMRLPAASAPDALGALEQVYIEQRDSFYLASVGEGGWPYVQHRGGAPGFLQVIHERLLAFADLSGNRQLISTGNVQRHNRVALILMDYVQQRRLKLLGLATIVPAAERREWLPRLVPTGFPLRQVERIYEIAIIGYDWNCPKYITRRYTEPEVQARVRPQAERVDQLEAALRAAGLPVPPPSSPSTAMHPPAHELTPSSSLH